MVSDRPKTPIKNFLDPVAPSRLNISLWGAVADPFVPVFEVFGYAKVALSILSGCGEPAQEKENPASSQGTTLPHRIASIGQRRNINVRLPRACVGGGPEARQF